MNNQWIDVNERLPEDDGDYLTIENYGYQSIKYFSHKHPFGEFITHWMPLPEPPKLV